jgi:predicted DNA-binding protein (MmcQ/YjbR family)
MKVDARSMEQALTLLRRFCAGLPAAEEYVMVHHPAFRVGKKPFVIAGMQQHERGATVSVNLGLEMQDQLLDDSRFSKTPYIGQHGWVTIAHADLRKGELEALVVGSFRRVANRKQLAALDGPTPASAASAGPTAKTKSRRR